MLITSRKRELFKSWHNFASVRTAFGDMTAATPYLQVRCHLKGWGCAMSGRQHGENERHYSNLSHKLSHSRRKLLIVHALHVLSFYEAEY